MHGYSTQRKRSRKKKKTIYSSQLSCLQIPLGSI
jgi:hypothetical protein